MIEISPKRCGLDISIVAETLVTLEMARLSLEKPAATGFADKFAVAHRDFTPDRHDLWPAFDGHPFECIVVHIHRLRFGRDGAAIERIIYDQVGVASQLDCAFARKKPE